MRIFGVAGWSGAGKTTLIRRLIPELVGQGLSVSTVKHAHHAFDVDQPGKDSFEHRQAGARQVLVASQIRWALMSELRGAPEPDLAVLLARLDPVDLVLVEGYKRDAHPKLEVWRAANGKPPIFPDDPTVIALATDAAPPGAALPVFALDDITAIADFVAERAVPL
ncbi:MAG TPA: molybdopterin-guanine dinucleotide biosynthesis protein B [Caulobacteraceae bacterium]|jgi:molybdopterin-guanine dinucleotide biosynthesis protein B|nr:molybdopterin-guanine dinucleotide biosynthesis protein B [Caulobacteraceae bacterium]